MKSWVAKAKHLKVLWNFGNSIYTPDPDESNQHIIELTKLIRERFDNQTELFSWSQALYQEVCFDYRLI